MPPRHPPPLVVGSSIAVLACASPDPTPSDLAAIELAAATEIVVQIASNPGSIMLICVGYADDRERPGLPSIGGPTPALAGMDGCAERQGRLVAADGGGQAVSVSVRTPEPTGGLRAEVSVFTSTGADDLAAYTCTVRREDGAWRAEGCELDAIS